MSNAGLSCNDENGPLPLEKGGKMKGSQEELKVDSLELQPRRQKARLPALIQQSFGASNGGCLDGRARQFEVNDRSQGGSSCGSFTLCRADYQSSLIDRE